MQPAQRWEIGANVGRKDEAAIEQLPLTVVERTVTLKEYLDIVRENERFRCSRRAAEWFARRYSGWALEDQPFDSEELESAILNLG